MKLLLNCIGPAGVCPRQAPAFRLEVKGARY
jgi:hypothetical protein